MTNFEIFMRIVTWFFQSKKLWLIDELDFMIIYKFEMKKIFKKFLSSQYAFISWSEISFYIFFKSSMGSLISAAVFKTGREALTTKVPDSFFDFKIRNIDGDIVDFQTYKGMKCILIVNVACKWGLTSENYKEMVKAHEKWRNSGF